MRRWNAKAKTNLREHTVAVGRVSSSHCCLTACFEVVMTKRQRQVQHSWGRLLMALPSLLRELKGKASPYQVSLSNRLVEPASHIDISLLTRCQSEAPLI